jgi:hypothetical protein
VIISSFLFETGIFLPLLSLQFDAFNDCGQIVGRSISPALPSPGSAEKSPASLLLRCLWDGALRAGAEQLNKVSTPAELKPVILGIA